MAELVDALDLGSSIERCGGSSPFARTIAARRHPGDAEHGICVRRLADRDLRNVTIKTVETENEGLKRAFMLTIPAKDIEARVEQEVKRIAPQMRMPGFRPGKVPPNLIRKMHGDSAAAAKRCNGAVQDGVQQLLSEQKHPPGAAAAGRARRGLRARQGRRGLGQPRGAARRAGAADRRSQARAPDGRARRRRGRRADQAARQPRQALGRRAQEARGGERRPGRHGLRRQGRRQGRSTAARARTCRSSSARAS